jgi:hypothetical protein
VPIEFAGKYSSRDMERSALMWLPIPRWLKLLSPFLLFCLAVYAFDAYAKSHDPAVFTVFWPFAAFGGLWLLTRWGARHTYKSNKALHDGVTGYATDQGLVFKTPYSMLDLPWSKYHRLVIKKDLIFLFHAQQQGQLLPRGFFASEDDWNAFRELASANVRKGEVVETPRWSKLMVYLLSLLFLLWGLWNSFSR